MGMRSSTSDALANQSAVTDAGDRADLFLRLGGLARLAGRSIALVLAGGGASDQDCQGFIAVVVPATPAARSADLGPLVEGAESALCKDLG